MVVISTSDKCTDNKTKKNLVKHIGTGKESTHIKSIQFRDRFTAKNIDFPLIHPENYCRLKFMISLKIQKFGK